MGFSTTAIHAGNEPDPTTGSVTVPIYQTSTYQQEALGHPRGGYEYARTQNPTREALEANVASLESGRHGVAFASGRRRKTGKQMRALAQQLPAACYGLAGLDDDDGAGHDG